MKKQHVNLTLEGKKALEIELQNLIKQRPVIAENIATARAFGDLSENEEYSAARHEQKMSEIRIAEIEDILKNAKIIQKSANHEVAIGSTVTVKANGKEFVYHIVGPVEADPLKGYISNQSPLGKALLKRKVGDTASLTTPKATTTYTITAIS